MEKSGRMRFQLLMQAFISTGNGSLLNQQRCIVLGIIISSLVGREYKFYCSYKLYQKNVDDDKWRSCGYSF